MMTGYFGACSRILISTLSFLLVEKVNAGNQPRAVHSLDCHTMADFPDKLSRSLVLSFPDSFEAASEREFYLKTPGGKKKISHYFVLPVDRVIFATTSYNRVLEFVFRSELDYYLTSVSQTCSKNRCKNSNIVITKVMYFRCNNVAK